MVLKVFKFSYVLLIPAITFQNLLANQSTETFVPELNKFLVPRMDEDSSSPSLSLDDMRALWDMERPSETNKSSSMFSGTPLQQCYGSECHEQL